MMFTPSEILKFPRVQYLYGCADVLRIIFKGIFQNPNAVLQRHPRKTSRSLPEFLKMKLREFHQRLAAQIEFVMVFPPDRQIRAPTMDCTVQIHPKNKWKAPVRYNLIWLVYGRPH